MKQRKPRTPKKRSNKYQKKISLYGMDEKEVVKELLKSPPMPKEDVSHVYEYLCAACGNEFILVAEDVPKSTPHCPNCGSSKIFKKKPDNEQEK